MKNLKGAFNDLVESMKRYDLYQKDDEVDYELTNLSNIIDEVEKRMQCVTNTNKDIRTLVSKYEDVILYYSNNDFELLQRSVNDIDIAIDLNINEPIECNWYGLFEDKFKPRSVSEYVATLPKEEVKVLIPKDSIVEWKETRQYYSVNGGAKARVTEDYTTEHEIKDLCVQVQWLDEKAKGQVSGGYILGMFKEDFELPSVPTELCKTPQTHEFVKDIIAKLKVIDVDGETMQYILKEVGMEEQMYRQLVLTNTDTDTKDLLEERRILSNRGCIEI
jgi:hypothetical protein